VGQLATDSGGEPTNECLGCGRGTNHDFALCGLSDEKDDDDDQIPSGKERKSKKKKAKQKQVKRSFAIVGFSSRGGYH
jgi:hypothetical protein